MFDPTPLDVSLAFSFLCDVSHCSIHSLAWLSVDKNSRAKCRKLRGKESPAVLHYKGGLI